MSLNTPNSSSVLIMKPESTVAECVRAMRDRGYGAVLISEVSNNRPAGIFTERDLLKWVDEIQKGTAWDQPVILFMSKPVLTISLEEIGAAPRIMIERGIRHLPVTHPDPDTGEIIVSMISMRDILRTLVQGGRFAKDDLLRSVRVGIMAKSKGVRQLIRTMCAERGNVAVQDISFELPDEARNAEVGELDYLIFDLDYIDAPVWAKMLRDLNNSVRHPEVILIYSPSLHQESEITIVRALGLSGRFSAYMKPLNLYAVMNRLV